MTWPARLLSDIFWNRTVLNTGPFFLEIRLNLRPDDTVAIHNDFQCAGEEGPVKVVTVVSQPLGVARIARTTCC